MKKLFYIFTAKSALIFPAHKAIVSSEFIFESSPFKSCHASTLCETKSNRILCSYFARSKEGSEDTSIYLSSLEDKTC